MGNVTAVPAGKGTPEEREEFETFRKGEDNLYSPGIRVGDEGFYDPTAGKDKAKNKPAAPSSNETPRVSNTDATPVKGSSDRKSKVNVISRERNSAVDSDVTRGVDSKSSGRKAGA